MDKKTNKFSPEVRERAVRMVGEHRADCGSEWAAMTAIAGDTSGLMRSLAVFLGIPK